MDFSRSNLRWFFLLALGFIVSERGATAHEATPLPKLVQPGKPVIGIEGHADAETVFRFEVPFGIRRLYVQTRGGVGDADLYVRHDVHPTEDDNDGQSNGGDNAESVIIENPSPGPWFARMVAGQAYAGVRLSIRMLRNRNAGTLPVLDPPPGTHTGPATIRIRGGSTTRRIRYTLDGSEPTAASPTLVRGRVILTDSAMLKARAFLRDEPAGPITTGYYGVLPIGTESPIVSGVAITHRNATRTSPHHFKMTVPEGRQKLVVHTSTGSGRSEVFIQHTAPGGLISSWRMRGSPGNSATITIPSPAAGDYTIELRARNRYAGVHISAQAAANLPDLTVWSPALLPYISAQNFPDSDCEVIEGLVDAGQRRLLRFTTESRNVGGGALFLGDPVGNPAFEYAACHDHYHFNSFARYRLLDSQGAVIRTGAKVSFCLLDVLQWQLNAPVAALFNCEYQGISPGWADVYDSGLPGQYVDITGLAAGEYQLEVIMDPDNAIVESDETNNAATIPVTIPAE